ncbi:MAG: helix-turn-helix transcriptional regulator [Candidatus Limnocylindrales bacterium]
MTGSPSPSRPSASIGVAIRRVRAGRYSMNELARRCGISPGVLSLIERGRGNPSFETMQRIADALGVPLTALLDSEGLEASGQGNGPGAGAAFQKAGGLSPLAAGLLRPTVGSLSQAALPNASLEGWRGSMTLRQGQEAVIQVNTGALELVLWDRTADLKSAVGGRQSLAIDVQVHASSPTPGLELPPTTDRRWIDLVTGVVPFRPSALACQILFTHATRCIKDDPSSPNVDRWVGELRAYFEQYETVAVSELSEIFG